MSQMAVDDRQDRFEEAIAAYLQAMDAGRPLDLKAWFAQYADLSTELEEFVADERQLEHLAGPIRPVPEPVCSGPIGDYEILEVIGWGGMGIVFKARHTKGNFLVALKMILTGRQADPEQIERFVREIELHASLDHDHVVPIFHVGEHQGLPYFTMKLAEAGTLKSRLSKFQLAPVNLKEGKAKAWPRAMIMRRAKRIARLMAKVAEGVHYAHQHRLLHRDLKPGNILLHGKDHAYVADFGLVARVDEAGQAGRVEGTPPYMAPEQARGIASLSTAVDVYGLGAILYELLTGQPPFTGPSKRDVLERVRTQEPAAPSQLQPRVPRDLEGLCLKCLHKDPAKRYASARQVARALNWFVEGKPVPGVQTPPSRRVVKWIRRKPAIAALIGAFALATGLGVATVV
ncbi:MAG TPA: serine/threonine-protein kinase, partial [Gemmataceae bacterium]|nr:serine/threonine-protein kinase [Gemmataceae bacterium]